MEVARTQLASEEPWNICNWYEKLGKRMGIIIGYSIDYHWTSLFFGDDPMILHEDEAWENIMPLVKEIASVLPDFNDGVEEGCQVSITFCRELWPENPWMAQLQSPISLQACAISMGLSPLALLLVSMWGYGRRPPAAQRLALAESKPVGSQVWHISNSEDAPGCSLVDSFTLNLSHINDWGSWNGSLIAPASFWVDHGLSRDRFWWLICLRPSRTRNMTLSRWGGPHGPHGRIWKTCGVHISLDFYHALSEFRSWICGSRMAMSPWGSGCGTPWKPVETWAGNGWQNHLLKGCAGLWGGHPKWPKILHPNDGWFSRGTRP